MSSIDQAFIQAYSSELPTAPVQPAEPATGAAVKFYPQGVTPPTAHHQAASVGMPTPHFGRKSTTTDPASETAALQQAILRQQSLGKINAPATERRPLSSFAEHRESAAAAFRPMFEVDAFIWPAVTSDLLGGHAALLVPVAQQLLSSSTAGRSMVGFAGTRPGVGCSTVMLSLARMLASTGKSIALVDADFENRALAESLGLEFDTGWEHVLTGQMPLAESVVLSVSDRIAVLPLAGHNAPAAELLSSIQTSVTAGVLRYHYDLVLFDLGNAGTPPQQSAAQRIVDDCRIDASIIVADATHCSAVTNEQVSPLMSLLGPTCLGVVGNSTNR